MAGRYRALGAAPSAARRIGVRLRTDAASAKDRPRGGCESLRAPMAAAAGDRSVPPARHIPDTEGYTVKTKSISVALAATIAAGGIATAAPAVATTKAKTIPKAQLIKRGDAICAKGNRGLTLAPPAGMDPMHPTPAQLRAAAPFLHQLSVVVGGEVRKVSALGAPDQDRALFERGMRGARRMVRGMRAQAAAAKAGDLDAFATASRRSNHHGDVSGRQLAQFGFKVCGH
jgi:hypothetical protein